MIKIINEKLPLHNFHITSSSNIYIVDYKDYNGGEVTLEDSKPEDIKFVHLTNEFEVEIVFDGFKENALPLEAGNHNSQCECLLFPSSCNESDWILFIETKYANDLKAAFNENYDYPNCMLRQIQETVSYFRDKEIIPKKKRVHAIVSFPNLIEEFSGFFAKDKIEGLLYEHQILLRPVNRGRIKSVKRIYL
tara:strand:- start:222 stop:797 length:576 start_codon:yes stop_codon:yes gene_type:complete